MHHEYPHRLLAIFVSNSSKYYWLFDALRRSNEFSKSRRKVEISGESCVGKIRRRKVPEKRGKVKEQSRRLLMRLNSSSERFNRNRNGQHCICGRGYKLSPSSWGRGFPSASNLRYQLPLSFLEMVSRLAGQRSDFFSPPNSCPYDFSKTITTKLKAGSAIIQGRG